MKVVCDTNIYISAAEFGGAAQQLLEELLEKEIILITSPDIIKEVSRMLREKFEWSDLEIEDTISSLLMVCILVRPQLTIQKIKKDPPDNKILECAVEGKADYIITGDKKHLLPLKKFQEIPIMSPQEFLKRVLYN